MDIFPFFPYLFLTFRINIIFFDFVIIFYSFHYFTPFFILFFYFKETYRLFCFFPVARPDLSRFLLSCIIDTNTADLIFGKRRFTDT